MLKQLQLYVLLFWASSCATVLWGQAADIEDRSYAYGYIAAQQLKAFQFVPTASMADHFVQGFKKALQRSPKACAAARLYLQQKETTTALTKTEAQQVAYAHGVLALGASPPAAEIPANTLEFGALRRGYWAGLQQVEMDFNYARMEQLYRLQQNEWRRRPPASEAEDPLKASPQLVKDRSYALGVQQALQLKRLNDPKVMDVSAFMAGAKTIPTTTVEALIESEVILETALKDGVVQPDLAYHAGRLLLGVRGNALQQWPKQLHYPSLEAGFQAVVREEVQQGTIYGERVVHQLVGQLAAYLSEQNYNRQIELKAMRQPVQLDRMPDNQPLDPALENPIHRRSYALGIWAVSLMANQYQQPDVAIDFEAFWQGLQTGKTLDEKAFPILASTLRHYSSSTYLPADPTEVSTNHGRFFLGHLLQHLSVGAAYWPSDLDQAWMRRGFEAAQHNQPWRMGRLDWEETIRLYQLLLVQRMGEQKAPILQKLSYAYGFLQAEEQASEVDVEHLFLGVVQSMEGKATEQLQQLRQKAHLTEAEQAYYAGLQVLGKQPPTTPIPAPRIEETAFKTGHQASTSQQPPKWTPRAMRNLVAAYQGHLYRHHQQVAYQSYKAHLKAGQQFLQDNAQRPEVVTLTNGVQYEVLQPGEAPTKEWVLYKATVHYQVKQLDGTILKDTRAIGQAEQLSSSAFIKGCKSVLQEMPNGAQYRFYIPHQHINGKMGTEYAPAGAMVVLELTLLDSKRVPPPY